MKRILFSLIICTLGFAETILIPEDYATIQAGIDASVDGDTVLVADGDYAENLVLDKSIVLTSHAIYDNLDEWIIFDDYFFNQWVINNSHIENTRLIGSSPDDPDYGSVILITPDSEECISPEIVGFTIQGGSGTKVVRVDDEGNEYDVVLGGGILADVSDPHIHHNAFENNGSEEVYSGGAAQLTSSAEDWSFDNRFENYNPRCDVEEFRLSDNLYNGNDAQYGNTMANRYHEDEFYMSGSIFDVFDCGNEENAVSTIWVKVEPEASVEYADGAGQLCAFTAPHVYVDSSIPQECLDEGCGFQNNPFKTIARTFEMINPTEDNPITIHLAAGTYSPETGETFPIEMMSNINIIGENEETTILNAMQTDRVIIIENIKNNIISTLTISGGLKSPYENDYFGYNGSGIYLRSSNPILQHVTIKDNVGYGEGGGMYIDDSHPYLTDVTIRGNVIISDYNDYVQGGGIYLYFSNPILTNVLIADNNGKNGGGLCISSSNPILKNVTFINNYSDNVGGGLAIYGGYPILTNVNIINNFSEISGGGIYLENSEPNIANSIIWNNFPQSIYINNGNPAITFSDIEGVNPWPGEGNINIDPLFVDAENENFNLLEGSPCINNADPNLWHNDQDFSRGDMGAKGGLFILPNFIDYSFGEIGNLGSSKQFTIYNYRETPINLDSVHFTTSIFSTETSFPTLIEPFAIKIIDIEANNSIIGLIQDEMSLESNDLPNDISILLSIEGVNDNSINGNLSGNYEQADYRITGDLIIADQDTVILQAGTKFLFDGEYKFFNYGVLKAIGTEEDSILFDNYGIENWTGFTLTDVGADNIFEYVRISGIRNLDDGAIRLTSSNPIFNSVLITNNHSWDGGGMYLVHSNPIMTNVNLSNNLAEGEGGGIYLVHSNPIMDM